MAAASRPASRAWRASARAWSSDAVRCTVKATPRARRAASTRGRRLAARPRPACGLTIRQTSRGIRPGTLVREPPGALVREPPISSTAMLRRLLPMLVLLCAVALAACGGNDGGDGGQAAAKKPTATATADAASGTGCKRVAPAKSKGEQHLTRPHLKLDPSK